MLINSFIWCGYEKIMVIVRIRVPIDQIESVNVEISKVDNQFAINRSALQKVWGTIMLESQARTRINAMLSQSNSLAGKIQSTDLEMLKYLQRVVRNFSEADNSSENITKNLFSSILQLSRGKEGTFQDRSFDLRGMYTALGVIVPVALLFPVIVALGWVKEGTLSNKYAGSVSSNRKLNNQSPDRRAHHNSVDNQYEQRKDSLDVR